MGSAFRPKESSARNLSTARSLALIWKPISSSPSGRGKVWPKIWTCPWTNPAPQNSASVTNVASEAEECRRSHCKTDAGHVLGRIRRLFSRSRRTSGSISRRWPAWDTVTRGSGLIVSLWRISSVTGHLGVAHKFLELPRLLPALESGIPFAKTDSAGLGLFGRSVSKTWRTVCRKESRPGQGAHDFNQSAIRKVHAYEWIGSMESVPGNGRSPAADDLFV